MRPAVLTGARLPSGWAALSWRIVLMLIGLTVLADELWNPPTRPQTAGTDPVANATQFVKGTASSVQEEFGVITERPLFHANRQPWTPPPPEPRQTIATAPPPAPPAPPRQPFGNYVLIGTMTSGTERIALLRPPNGSRTVILREGQSVDGWTLRSVSEDRARFESGSSVHELAIPSRRQAGRNG